MMEYRWFVLDVNPEPWEIGPVGVARSEGKLRPYVGRNAQLAAFQQAVKEEIGDPDKFTGKFSVRFVFWRNRAEYVTPQARTHRKHEADTTNLQKATEDALQKVLFDNDKDVLDIRSTLVEQGPDVKGRIVIGIKVIERELELPDLPQEVWDLLDALDSQSAPSDNSWPPKGGF